ncbi:hypothetical protein GLAREA_03444 [Glarea lozoyensis ATCC 20868]|uniref:Uncharacterized protein n=1 Tax=Glarea lozoyensis (strain ATCC 20868 / MF5171) TaxID=1116229 RepID=S3CVN7_GLAL2|nr:uncharacterized protein GLAREA_03444 [Glarea lozoyensis ATCC 20868]EPE30477.1 hypothetical protein GLAREA_03444 [Glarea lozoyensis ATCC 20868]
MHPLFAITTAWCLFALVSASPGVEVKRDEIGSGCHWCSEGPWTTATECDSGEYWAVANSMRNPPENVTLDVTAFCSQFLRPLVTDTSVITETAGTTIQTSTSIWLTLFTPTSTAPTTTIPTGFLKMRSPHAAPEPTASPELRKPRADLAIQEYTVPEYLTDWYWYGRLDPGCSCIITSAAPSVHFSETSTTTLYDVTLSATVTETYTIWPKSKD